MWRRATNFLQAEDELTEFVAAHEDSSCHGSIGAKQYRQPPAGNSITVEWFKMTIAHTKNLES